MKSSFRQELKARAHHLKPVILLGAKGLTEALLIEIDLTLSVHELIKIKLHGIEKEDRETIAEEICRASGSELVQLIGNTAVVWRKKPE